MKQDPHRVRFFGIRHHGPGSARSLDRTLQDWKPDLLLIEGPQDADLLLSGLQADTLRPPVALLIYDPKDLKAASYFPLAAFSPEWVAIQYGIRHSVAVHFIDLPQGMMWNDTLSAATGTTEDPFSLMAGLQGYPDAEVWWESHFENQENAAVFPALSALIREMRLDRPESPRNEVREAFMRQQIRQYASGEHRRIAVVCGAWHLPALETFDRTKTTADKSRWKGLALRRMQATWIPWSYRRLAKSSGYLAGVEAPMWYERLFAYGENAPAHWFAYVGRSLRTRGYETTPSSAIDATRLAETLAAIRDLPRPGYAELGEAASAVLGHSHPDVRQIILEDIPVGDKVGSISADLPQLPIVKDLELQVRKLRWRKDMEHSSPVSRSLDLRKASHREGSILLHRLQLLDIAWGTLQAQEQKQLGTFREDWTLQWDPEFFFKLIESGSFGLTIAEACAGKLRDEVSGYDLARLVRTLQICLAADLPALLTDIATCLAMQSTACKDAFLLMEAFCELGSLMDFGSVRQLDMSMLASIRDDIAIEIIASVAPQADQLDPLEAGDICPLFLRTHFQMLRPPATYKASWLDLLHHLGLRVAMVNQVHGCAFRLLLESEDAIREPFAFGPILFAVFSAASQPMETAAWLEGFLQENWLILLYDERIWRPLEQWVDQIGDEAFEVVLPVLRRSFANAGPGLKEKLLAKASGHNWDTASQPEELPSGLRRQLIDWLADEREDGLSQASLPPGASRTDPPSDKP